MTAAALIILASLGITLAVSLTIAIVRGDNRADQLIEERAAHQTTRAKLERREFEWRECSAALAEANKRIAVLSAAAEKRIDESGNEDLPGDDLDSRRVRAAIKAKAAAARGGGEVRPASDADVRAPSDSAEPAAAEVLAAGPLDPDEVLR